MTSDSIDIQLFAAALQKVKQQKGYSWRQMALATGRSQGFISSLATTKHKKTIRKDTAEDIFRRLAGEVLPPTQHQLAQYRKKSSKLQREDRQDTMRLKAVEEKNARVQALSLRLGTDSF